MKLGLHAECNETWAYCKDGNKSKKYLVTVYKPNQYENIHYGFNDPPYKAKFVENFSNKAQANYYAERKKSQGYEVKMETFPNTIGGVWYVVYVYGE